MLSWYIFNIQYLAQPRTRSIKGFFSRQQQQRIPSEHHMHSYKNIRALISICNVQLFSAYSQPVSHTKQYVRLYSTCKPQYQQAVYRKAIAIANSNSNDRPKKQQGKKKKTKKLLKTVRLFSRQKFYCHFIDTIFLLACRFVRLYASYASCDMQYVCMWKL